MAATSADLTGVPGAVVVTRGPGLASAVNGIAHAALDRLPVVVIADTVTDARISHQRIDQAALGRSVAKAAVSGERAADGRGRPSPRRWRHRQGPVIANMDDSAADQEGPPRLQNGVEAQTLRAAEDMAARAGRAILAEAVAGSEAAAGAARHGGDPADRGGQGRAGRPRYPGAAHLPGPRRAAGLRRRGGRAGHRGHDGVAAAQRGRSDRRAGRGRGRDDPGAVGLRGPDDPGQRAGSAPGSRLVHRRDRADHADRRGARRAGRRARSQSGRRTRAGPPRRTRPVGSPLPPPPRPGGWPRSRSSRPRGPARRRRPSPPWTRARTCWWPCRCGRCPDRACC